MLPFPKSSLLFFQSENPSANFGRNRTRKVMNKYVAAAIADKKNDVICKHVNKEARRPPLRNIRLTEIRIRERHIFRPIDAAMQMNNSLKGTTLGQSRGDVYTGLGVNLACCFFKTLIEIRRNHANVIDSPEKPEDILVQIGTRSVLKLRSACLVHIAHIGQSTERCLA